MTVSAYRDHGGHTDWNCGGITYDGHGGTDFAIYGGWGAVDEGREVLAAADGVVVQANDGEFDRCTTGACSGGGGFGNYVAIQHADGVVTYYGHQRTGSIAVGVGDTVTCGQHLGFIASSGASTGPHVHFEPRNPSGFDPFGGGGCSDGGSHWNDQGAYAGLPGQVCPVTDMPPEGWLDAAACDGMRGWARDPDAPDVAVDVVLTIDAPLFAAGSVGFRTTADVASADVGPHRFSIPAPYGFMDGRDHPVFAYAGGAAGGAGAQLSGSPGTLHCDRPPLPFPDGVIRHVTDPDSFAAWQFGPGDIVVLDDSTLAALHESDPWPARPELFAAAGDPAVYLRDVRNGVAARRHVPSPDAMSAWRLDWGAIAIVDLAARDMTAADVEISARPYLVRGSGPAIYVVDAPPPALPMPDAGPSGPSEADAGVGQRADGSIGPGADASVARMNRASASGCSASPGRGAGGAWIGLALVLGALPRRRR
jgi:murein DD-endopeptidase MepM/ murein hydrolase activator NlpD